MSRSASSEVIRFNSDLLVGVGQRGSSGPLDRPRAVRDPRDPQMSRYSAGGCPRIAPKEVRQARRQITHGGPSRKTQVGRPTSIATDCGEVADLLFRRCRSRRAGARRNRPWYDTQTPDPCTGLTKPRVGLYHPIIHRSSTTRVSRMHANTDCLRTLLPLLLTNGLLGLGVESSAEAEACRGPSVP